MDCCSFLLPIIEKINTVRLLEEIGSFIIAVERNKVALSGLNLPMVLYRKPVYAQGNLPNVAVPDVVR